MIKLLAVVAAIVLFAIAAFVTTPVQMKLIAGGLAALSIAHLDLALP
jgi:hypothetical protein